MLEVIIDPEVGTILGHSVYTESDISPELVCCIINDVEMMDIALACKDFYQLELFKGSKGSKNTANGAMNNGDSDDDDDTNEVIEPEYLEKVMKFISKFLKVDRMTLQPTLSLILFSLDFIRSVGLSHATTMIDFQAGTTITTTTIDPMTDTTTTATDTQTETSTSTDTTKTGTTVTSTETGDTTTIMTATDTMTEVSDTTSTSTTVDPTSTGHGRNCNGNNRNGKNRNGNNRNGNGNNRNGNNGNANGQNHNANCTMTVTAVEETKVQMSSPVHQCDHDNAATCTVMVTATVTAIQECVYMETQTLVYTTLATDCDVSAEACHNCHANHSCASHY